MRRRIRKGDAHIMSGVLDGVLEEVIADDRKNCAIRMLKDGTLTNEKIAMYLDLPLKKIEEWAKEL